MVAPVARQGGKSSGLIYVGAGRPAWRLGTEACFFRIVPHGIAAIRYRSLIYQNCSP